jgi:hypothetical protein
MSQLSYQCGRPLLIGSPIPVIQYVHSNVPHLESGDHCNETLVLKKS